MNLEDNQKEILIQKLQTVWSEPRDCPICRKNDWTIVDKIYEIREFYEGNFVIGGGGAIFPLIAVVCKVCGYTLFFNAILLGIVKADLKEVSNDK
jgi:hypothetical protein